MKTYRQGDVLFILVASVPKDAQRQNSNVIVHGETTGHAHRLEGGDIMTDRNQMFVVAGEEAKIVHEEHAEIYIPQGVYKVIRQREYDEKEIRYVSD